MRNIVFSFLIGLVCLFNSNSYAQAPEKFNYQAVIRDNTGELIINQSINVRVAIIDNTSDGTILYRETHSETTSGFGLVNLQIGTGTSDMGTFSDIDWGTNPKYLQIEIDASGGTNYTDLGTFQLLSVPYALYANDVANKDDADADPLNEIQDLDLSGNNLSISGGSTVDLSIIQDGVDDSDADSTNEIQDLDLTGTDLSITGGNTVNLSPIQDGVTDADADPANEIQNLLLAGDTLKISNGNEVVLPYDSSNWVISGDQMYYNGGNVGIGSLAPLSNLEVKSNTAGSDALFQVINANNDTVFAVYPDGVKVFIDPDAKGRVGGFAISGRSPSKAGIVEYMRVTTDSTRIYVNEPIDGKGRVGGFAISGRSPSKGIVNDYLVVTGDSTRIYVNDSLTVKGRVGGFAISGRSPSKGIINDYLQVTRDSTRIYVTESTIKGKVGGFAISGRSPSKGVNRKFMDITVENYYIGHETGQKNEEGLYNSLLGYHVAYNSISGSRNVFLGYQAGFNNCTGGSGGDNNVFLGHQSGYDNRGGNNNIFIGNLTGLSCSNTNNNIIIGSEAGQDVVGENNIILGYKAGMAASSSNVIIGDEASSSASANSTNCVIIGRFAGQTNQGTSNVFLGQASGAGHTTGNNNVFIGAGSGLSNLTGSGNVFVGYDAGRNETGSSKLYIDNSNVSTPLIYGDFSANSVQINGYLCATTHCFSDRRYKKDFKIIDQALENLMKIDGVYFNWRTDEFPNRVFNDRRQIGVIAQNVEEFFPELIRNDKDGYKTVDYSKLTPILIESVKELNKKLEIQEKRNAELENRLSKIEKLLIAK